VPGLKGKNEECSVEECLSSNMLLYCTAQRRAQLMLVVFQKHENIVSRTWLAMNLPVD
jgi:hypothetical protein